MRWLMVGLVTMGPWLTDDVRAQAFAVEPAYHSDGTVWFVVLSGREWAELAPEGLRSLPIPTDDPAVVARFAPEMDVYGSVEVRTTVPPPGPLDSLQMYFVGPAGVQPLALDSTLVVTRIGLDPGGTRLESRTFWGEAFGRPSPRTEGGGFVLLVDRTLSFEEIPAELTADDLVLGGYLDSPAADGDYPMRGTAFWEIIRQYRFTVHELPGEWLFVQWAPDHEGREAGCEYRYDLLRLESGGDVRRVASNSYGCDV